MTPVGADADGRYKRSLAHVGELQEALVDVFIRTRSKQGWLRNWCSIWMRRTTRCTAINSGSSFMATYGGYCFLPLYTFCGPWPLGAVLPILRWCEEHGVDYVIGLSKNKRLVRALRHELHRPSSSSRPLVARRGSSKS